MKMYLKQKVFSWGDKFTVYDENGNDLYRAQGEVFSLGKKLHILDLNENELCFIRQKVFSWMPKFYISKNGIDVAEVKRKFSFFRPSYIVTNFGWNVEGDFFAHEYSILKNDRFIASISKEWFSWGDAYEIDVESCSDALYVLAVVLVIDACLEQESNADT